MVNNSALANQLRRDVLEMTTVAKSGHATSCLSCAEIMAALFFETMHYDPKNPKNPDNDEFILSKGHAAPILYACLHRAGCIDTPLYQLRALQSPLEGHPTPSLPWVKIATGSLGQGLSAGVGMALAAKLQDRHYQTFVLLGDSECAEGSVWEAAELASYYKLNNLVAIVDVNRLGQRGATMLGGDTKTYKERFESFGWQVLVVNGHDAAAVHEAIRTASPKPLAVIAKTIKGKGVSFLEDKNGWHGKALSTEELAKALKSIPAVKLPPISIKKPSSSISFPKAKTPSWPKYSLEKEVATREAYGDTLAALAKADPSVLAIDGEVSNSTYAEKVKEKNPKQFIEAFIAEQNMIGMSLGLAAKGHTVFASTFGAFLTRAHDQLRMAAISNTPMIVSGSHAGVSIGEDGASQMALEDIALFRSLPNSVILYPSDATSTQKLVQHATNQKGITYLRTTRSKTPVLYKSSESFPVGEFKVLRESKQDKAVLVGAGITLHEALKAHDMLKKEVNTAVIDLYSIKPFNAAKFISFVKAHGSRIVIAEDHYAEGGIGEMLCSVCKNESFKIEHLAVREIPHSGTKEELLAKYGIDVSSIVTTVRKLETFKG